ncbi:diamine n-acetyltransferase [Holotrichia oblita]|uniref:Diamine n-acetyltransferase n=1 Tax=Holotrichia oblita TaxID=644536 RepID=A0ACB9TCL7_HOLOL|nr:diamine n-acetyltransferase [Holotrichia oblita]
MTNIIIRPARKDDMIAVYGMIKKLAEFEQMPEQVIINETVLMKDGFETNSPAFSCFVAEIDNTKVIGYAIYYTCYSTWRGKSIFLEDLYVDPEYRKLGAGKKLFLAVAKIAHETSHRLDFHVLAWNPAVTFYKKIGAIDLTSLEDWHTFRMDEDALNKLFQ